MKDSQKKKSERTINAPTFDMPSFSYGYIRDKLQRNTNNLASLQTLTMTSSVNLAWSFSFDFLMDITRKP